MHTYIYIYGHRVNIDKKNRQIAEAERKCQNRRKGRIAANIKQKRQARQADEMEAQAKNVVNSQLQHFRRGLK